MAQTISLNDASEDQLVTLLGLTADQARAIIGRRPFVSAEAAASALPRATAAKLSGVDVPLLNINDATASDLARIVRIAPDLAQSILAGRPYYSLFELRRHFAGDPAAFARLAAFFCAAEFSYRDKLSGNVIRLVPDRSRMLVRFAEGQTESAKDVGHPLGLKPMSARTRSPQQYAVYDARQVESGADPVAALRKEASVASVMPSFKDKDGCTRYADGELCLVQFQHGASLVDQSTLLASIGAAVQERHRTPGLLTVRIPGAGANPALLINALATFNASDKVKFAEPAYIGLNDLESAALRAVPAVETETAAVPWNLQLVRAVEAWGLTTGSEKIVVAVIDTGVDMTHPALAGGLVPRPQIESWNFTDVGGADPDDDEGHGTFIAGLLVGNGAMGIRGLCPQCRVLPLKVPLEGATQSYGRRRDAILYALDFAPPDTRLIINLSWKTTGDIAAIRDAINVAASRNALVVCSAGNWPNGPSEPHFPSDYPSNMSVGAVSPDERRAVYSFYGAEVDLAAPGGSGSDVNAENITSSGLDAGLAVDFGTSFSAPHVAGAAALVWSRFPNLAQRDVRTRLEGAAKPLADDGLGRGLLDAAAGLGGGAQIVVTPPASADSAGLDAVNNDDLATLIAAFHLLPITARLLIAHRPFSQLDEIRGILGLTDEQFEAIAAFSGV
ncbi:S8 family serine peptidase [Rhodoblastus acidophilus]|uniref:S8 family serine peptidase n=1 Tax=Candidatus Rhodoblastus alkanivorans TaxID=2954117 RepID=A0ABS9Z159_9HYPH|nr:S8 family serine peptidase [Candidatus Rhodoblastus alkanivorans]MCI4678166.1 S8 family serine peptidase [Candidatus Rhodoblastus alkanivorans]MCI4681216.1 S8 family serine peptidase [Candidatus Rhodoblastus alkanivorans]MDI4642259.1 S8 family serine peptidase [Rhodoblastus acidophilus]